MKDWAENVVFYNRKCFWGPEKVTSLARRVAVCVFMLGSWSDHSRIVSSLEMTFHLFSKVLSEILRGKPNIS